MTKAITTEIGGGKTILIEVDEEPQPISMSGPGGTTAGFAKPKELVARLDEVGDTIAVMCTTLFEKMKAGFAKGAPSEVSVEFGITLGGEAGIPFVTKGKADATFKVTSKWSISPEKWKRTRSMCDFVPGELLISHDNSDEAAAGLVGRIREKEFPHIGFDASLEERLLDARLPIRKDIGSSFYKVRVPEGQEQFKGEILHSLYAEEIRSRLSKTAKVPPFLGDTRRAFNVVPNSILITCFSFSQPQHDTYKAMFGWHRPSDTTKTICIIDSGISATTGFKVTSKHNFLDWKNKDDVTDDHPIAHGTAVAEIIRDLCPDAPLVIHKVVNSERRATEWDTLAALVVDSGADIINMSLAFGLEDFACPKCGRQSHSSRSAVFEKLINDLSQQDVIVVAAAGNQAEPQLSFPARFGNVVAIEAITQMGKLASYTNHGAIDSEGVKHNRVFVLPGGNREMEESAKPTEWMAVSNGEDLVGTSFAAAYGSAIIAHSWHTEFPNGSADQLIARLAAKIA